MLTFRDRVIAEKIQLERALIQCGCRPHERLRFGFRDSHGGETVRRDIREYQGYTETIIHKPRREARKKPHFKTPRR